MSLRSSFIRLKACVLRGLVYPECRSSYALAVYFRYRDALPPPLHTFLTFQEFQLACLLLFECRYHAPYCFRNVSELLMAYLILRAEPATQKQCEIPLETLYRACWESFFLLFDQSGTVPMPVDGVPIITFEDIAYVVDGMDARVVEWIRKEAWVPRIDRIASQCEMIERMSPQSSRRTTVTLCDDDGTKSMASAETVLPFDPYSPLSTSSSWSSQSTKTGPPFGPTLRQDLEAVPVLPVTGCSSASPSSPLLCACGDDKPCRDMRVSFIKATRQYWLATLSQVFFIWPPPVTMTMYCPELIRSRDKSRSWRLSSLRDRAFRRSFVKMVPSKLDDFSRVSSYTVSSSRSSERGSIKAVPKQLLCVSAENNSLVAEIDFLWSSFQTAAWWNDEKEQALCRRGFDAFLARRQLISHRAFE